MSDGNEREAYKDFSNWYYQRVSRAMSGEEPLEPTDEMAELADRREWLRSELRDVNRRMSSKEPLPPVDEVATDYDHIDDLAELQSIRAELKERVRAVNYRTWVLNGRPEIDRRGTEPLARLPDTEPL